MIETQKKIVGLNLKRRNVVPREDGIYEFELIGQEKVAVIRLKGEPYRKVLKGETIDCTDTLESLAHHGNYEKQLRLAIERNIKILEPLFQGGYYGIDAKIKKGQPLTYEEAFCLMTFVSMGVNKLVYKYLHPSIPEGMPNDPETIFYQSISLLSAMSAKEGYVGLTPTEIAGMTASVLEIDTIIRVPSPGITFAMGGMGGDRGYKKNGDNSKLFSLSTLTAAVLANFGYVHKHHSYPNTSKVAGQSAIESFGARSDQNTAKQLENLQSSTGLLMSSCHTTRTIHTLSHQLKGETINHVVGPLSIPISVETSAIALIGVNDNVHPETIIEALSILKSKGVQNYSNSVAFCGLNHEGLFPEHFSPEKYYKSSKAKLSVAIDEVAPPPYQTLASFLVNGKNQGTYAIDPEDFMDKSLLREIEYRQLLVPNTFDDIMNANRAALQGTNRAKTLYLAMTGALALFTKNYAHLPGALDKTNHKVNREYLRQAYSRVLKTIMSGKGYQKLLEYVSATNNK